MTTPYVDELALISKNNEGISEVIELTVEIDGVDTPVDLTGYTFFAQARSAKNKTAELLCEVQIEVLGNPVQGKLLLTVSDEVMRDLPVVKGHYDVLVRSGAGSVDNLYMAPFQVGNGVTDIEQWLP